MSTIKKEISSTTRGDGKSQIYLRVTITRTNRPRIKSGLFVSPEYFDKSKGVIVVPRKGKLNASMVDELKGTSVQLDTLCGNINAICLSGECNGVLVTKEWIIEVLNLEAMNMLDKKDPFSWTSIEKGLRMMETKQREAEERESQASRKLMLGQLFDLYLARKNFSFAHEKHVRVLQRDLERWEMFKQSEDSSFVIDIDTLTKDDVEDFEDYLRNESTLKEENEELFNTMLEKQKVQHNAKRNVVIEERADNTLKAIMKCYKSFFRWLYDSEHTANDPFKKYRIEQEIYGTPFYLTLEERKTLEEYDLSSRPNLAIQRDIFLFQSMVGCRVSDLYKLTESNISNGIMEYVPHKTLDGKQQVKPRIPLLPKAKELVEKYKGVDRRGRLFPFISTQKYNTDIKTMLSLAGINRPVPILMSKNGKKVVIYRPICEVASSHMGRRNFVGSLYKLLKDPALIGKMSGHVEGSRSFQRYRNVDDADLAEAINLIK